MVAFITMNLVHVVVVVNCVSESGNQHDCNRGDGKKSTESYLIYNLLAISACAIIVLAKISEDLFIQLNRDRSIVKISIF